MKTYHYVIGTIFAVVALVHLMRIINHWTLIVGPWDIPTSLSWAAVVVTAALSLWSFRLVR
jgi:hypothetical protein